MITKDLQADSTRICRCLVWLGLTSASFCPAAASPRADMLFSQMVFRHWFLSQVCLDEDVHTQAEAPNVMQRSKISDTLNARCLWLQFVFVIKMVHFDFCWKCYISTMQSYNNHIFTIEEFLREQIKKKRKSLLWTFGSTVALWSNFWIVVIGMQQHFLGPSLLIWNLITGKWKRAAGCVVYSCGLVFKM